jgi:hypothetical protein
MRSGTAFVEHVRLRRRDPFPRSGGRVGVRGPALATEHTPRKEIPVARGTMRFVREGQGRCGGGNAATLCAAPRARGRLNST